MNLLYIDGFMNYLYIIELFMIYLYIDGFINYLFIY